MWSDVPQLSGPLTGCSVRDVKLMGGMGQDGDSRLAVLLPEAACKNTAHVGFCPQTKVDKQMEQSYAAFINSRRKQSFFPIPKLDNT